MRRLDSNPILLLEILLNGTIEIINMELPRRGVKDDVINMIDLIGSVSGDNLWVIF